LCKPDWEETCSIQGDTEGNVNILGGEIIGQCEKKSSYMKGPRQSCLNLQIKKIVNVIEKGKLLTVNFNFNLTLKC
jgi:hypothetical protein